MSTPPITPFDLGVAPVDGLTVLEASAGTGKTYSLAGLTVLGLATGRVTTREVLVVTFTEAATAELSGRLRRRLADAVDPSRRATRRFAGGSGLLPRVVRSGAQNCGLAGSINGWQTSN